MKLVILYKIGQLFGIAATLSLAIGLMFGFLYEPNVFIKGFEIVGSIVAATVLALDILDLHPKVD